MQEQINQLKQQIQELLDWKFQKERQQISFPIDQTSMSIINQNNGKVAVGGIYLSITGVNPSIELGYGTWSAVANDQVLRGTTGAAGGTGAAVGDTTGVITYLINVWLRTT